MDRLQTLSVFAKVVESGSFSAAAEKLGLSRAAASKQVLQLEEHLGTRLLNRTTRRLSLTEEGGAFYERAVRILAELEEAEREASSGRAEPRGTLRVSAPVSFGICASGVTRASTAPSGRTLPSVAASVRGPASPGGRVESLPHAERNDTTKTRAVDRTWFMHPSIGGMRDHAKPRRPRKRGAGSYARASGDV